MSGETKLVNASLFAFNNQILAMSNVVKKAKINIIQKLIRKIKLLANKKGNEAELAKNKRKCDNLKHEIESVKKAKLNDIAILALDNDGIKYEEFMKKNSKISGDEVAIARVAFHKLVESELEKIKNDPKLEGGWKKIFIQFKSRNEKRKNWKEKQKLYKIIEEKLQVKNEDEDGEEKDEAAVTTTEDNEAPQDEVGDEVKAQEVAKADKPAKKKAEEKKEKKKSKVKEDETPLIDTDGQAEDEKAVAYNPDDDEEELLNMEREVAFSDDDGDSEAGSMPDFGLSFGEGEDSDAPESDHSAPVKKKPKTEPKPVIEVPKRELKPLVVDNKPPRMVIKQINLDELKDLNEIPIETTSAVGDDDGDDDEDEPALKPREEPESNDYGEYARSNTIKATEDPFFLDPNGREIQDIHNLTEKNNALYYNNRFNKPRYRKDDDDFDYNFDEKDEFIQKRTNLNNSSFKSSLSSRDGGYRSNGRGDGRSFNSERSYGQRPQRFDPSQSRGRGNPFRPSNGAADYQRNKRPFEHNSFNRSSQSNTSDPPKPSSVELAKNHPSWLAKKQQEEKLKAQKFEGKKIVFDD